MTELILPAESYRVMGACFEVYKQMGCGFLEAVYQECLALEFTLQGIPFVAQPFVELSYKDQPLVQRYRPDFVCFGQIVVEIKANSALTDGCRAQVINYLHAVRKPLALLVNFGPTPESSTNALHSQQPHGSDERRLSMPPRFAPFRVFRGGIFT